MQESTTTSGSGQSDDVRRFHIGDLLSVTTGRLVGPTKMRGVYDILNFMARDNMFTHQLPRTADECRPYLLAQFPWLKSAGVGLELYVKAAPYDRNQSTEANCLRWLIPLITNYGEWHDVRRIPMDDHDIIDGFDEAISLLGEDRVITVDLTDDDEPPPYGDLPGIGGGQYPADFIAPVAPQQPVCALDVATELVYLRSRRRLTRAEYEMADVLWQNQLLHARRENTVPALAALWMADLAAMYGEG